MLCRLPSAARFCSRSCATLARVKKKELRELSSPNLLPAAAPGLSDELRAAKDLSMLRIVEVFRGREKEFTPKHCLATLVLMDSEASERAHTARGYEINLSATGKLPETRRLFEKAASDASSLEPHMFGNLLMLAHAFGMEQHDGVMDHLVKAANDKLPGLNEEALEQILDGIGHDRKNYWTSLIQSLLPERPRKPLAVANTIDEAERTLLQNRQPLIKLLDPETRQQVSDDDLAQLADSTNSLGAIDPNDLHKIVKVYADAGVRNARLLRLICDFAMVSWCQLSLQNLRSLSSEFERIGFHDKVFMHHLLRRMPSDGKIVDAYKQDYRHTRRMAVLTRIDRPWSQPRFGKRYAAPEWDSNVDNRDNYFILQRQARLSPSWEEKNKERSRKGLPRLPIDGILCPWLDERIYGGGKKLLKKTPKHKIFPGLHVE